MKTSAESTKMPFPALKYYLYIMQLHSSGHFYIGVTANAKRREAAHLNQIKNIILGMKRNADPDDARSVHTFFAKRIKPLVDHLISPNRTIAWHYSFSIKYSCYTAEEIKEVENIFLEKFQYNPKCLNNSLSSAYPTKAKTCSK